jgi:glycosyltransferase involved in cell wall biosynthesis
MRIAVVVSMEAGVEKAYAINSVNMAQGFAKLGHDVILITFAHREGRRSLDDLRVQYDVRVPLRWIQLPRVFRKRFISPDLPFALMALFHLFRLRPDFVFSRSYIAPVLSARYGFLTIAESHSHTDNQSQPFITMIDAITQYPQFRKLITISDVLSEHYQTLGVPEDKLLVLPTGVDIDRFEPPSEPTSSPYTTASPNVVYVGHLYDYKGIPTILEASKLCPRVNFHLVGGLRQDIDRVQQIVDQEELTNVTLHGFKPQVEIPPYLHHADILLLPPFAESPQCALDKSGEAGRISGIGNTGDRQSYSCVGRLDNRRRGHIHGTRFCLQYGRNHRQRVIESATRAQENGAWQAIGTGVFLSIARANHLEPFVLMRYSSLLCA